jgi:hypothetical protein
LEVKVYRRRGTVTFWLTYTSEEYGLLLNFASKIYGEEWRSGDLAEKYIESISQGFKVKFRSEEAAKRFKEEFKKKMGQFKAIPMAIMSSPEILKVMGEAGEKLSRKMKEFSGEMESGGVK